MGDTPRILIVDDENIVCNMARTLFEHEGYEVETFTDSRQALERLQSQSFDVMVTDLKMKEVDGLQLLEFVNEKWPDTKVIMLTAFATMETAIESFRKQAFDFFSKPVKLEDLKKSVNRALKQS